MPSFYKLERIKPRKGWVQPTKEQYVKAFSSLPESSAMVLKIQVACPGHGATVRQLARLADYKDARASNVRYGHAAKLVSSSLGVLPPQYWSSETPNWWSILSIGSSDFKEFVWVMRSEAVAACEELGWIRNSEVFSEPSEADVSANDFLEGKYLLVPTPIYERSQQARRACLKHYGSYECQICGFDFAARYGKIGEGFIHVHHLELLSASEGKERRTNPVTDLLPICPNCHAMIHKRNPQFSPDELRDLIKSSGGKLEECI